jgi:uncharacterized lipoprotein
MKTVLKAIAALLIVSGLGACAMLEKVEMPTNEGDSSDRMLQSPCACIQIDHNNKGYTWHA